MNKKTLVIVVALLLLLGGGFYVMSSKNKNKLAMKSTGTEETSVEPQESPKTLKDLLSRGIAQKCTYADTVGAAKVEGTSYIAGGKVRADFSTTAEGKVSNGHTIFDGKTSYVWMDDSKTGFKMEIDPAAIKTDSTAETNQGVDLNKSLDYNCGVWVTDQSKFEAPADVTFSAFGQGPTGTQGGSMPGSQNLCEACNSLTGDQKTQCLAALKCN